MSEDHERDDDRLPVHRLARWFSTPEDDHPGAWPRGAVALLGIGAIAALVIAYLVL